MGMLDVMAMMTEAANEGYDCKTIIAALVTALGIFGGIIVAMAKFIVGQHKEHLKELQDQIALARTLDEVGERERGKRGGN